MPLLERPPWRNESESGKRWMRAWVNQELNLETIRYNSSRSRAEVEQARAEFDAWINTPLAMEISSAEDGDIEPLRRALPHLARFLHLPKQPNGVRRPMDDEYGDRVRVAVNDVTRIRALWQRRHHKKNRPKGQVTAEEIAAERWRVNVEDVLAKLKKI
jgi:hypothetical protein